MDNQVQYEIQDALQDHYTEWTYKKLHLLQIRGEAKTPLRYWPDLFYSSNIDCGKLERVKTREKLKMFILDPVIDIRVRQSCYRDETKVLVASCNKEDALSIVSSIVRKTL